MDIIFTRLAILLLIIYVDLSTSENPSVRTTAVQNKTCKITEFKCANDRCIQLNHYCNNKNDCGDTSDEPRYCTRCNRTYYGVIGKTYDLELHRPKGDKIPFVCYLTFVASGGQYGELIQITFDSFTLGRFTSFTVDGCPDGALQIFESGRPHVGGSWCGTAWGPAIYYSETKRITIVVNLIRLSKIDSGYNFDYRMNYKFLKKNTAIVRYGGSLPSMFYNTTEPTVETEPSYYLGELISGTYCSRIFSDCDKKHCRLQSPNFPGVYPRNLTCYYAVRQHEIPPRKHALIIVRQTNGQLIWIRSQSNLYSTASTRHLKVWDDCNDVQDYVTIYDGYTTRDPVILKFCGGGEAIPQTVSSGHELLVEFSTSPYGTFLQASPAQALHGFQLEVEVKFVDEDSPTFMKQKHSCEFWIRGTDRGVLESPLHSLPANTTCLYHLQGLDTSVSPSPVPFRTSNDRYPDWSRAGVLLPPSRYRVWLSLIKFNAANVWDPTKLEASDTCKSYLNVWDGQLWTPTNCKGILCGNLKNATKSRGSSITKKNVTLLARYCKEHKPKSCEHSVFKNATHTPRPCSPLESFLTSGDSLTLELKLGDSTALSDVTFKALYEFVDLKVDGEPFTEEVCYRKFVATSRSDTSSSKNAEPQKFRSPRNIFMYGRGGAKNLSCIYRFEANKDQRIKVTITDIVLKNRSCFTEIDKNTDRLECIGNTSATIRFLEYPANDVPGVPKNCICFVDKKLIPLTYISTTNVVELKFNVVDMTAAEDFDSLLFEGNWKAIQAPQCTKEMRYQGPSGIIIFSHPPTAEEINCASSLRTIIPSQNKYLYVKILGFIMKYTNMLSDGSSKTTFIGQRCETLNRIMVYTPLYSVIICPYDPYYRQDGFVEIFSEGWSMKSDRHHIKVGQSVVNTINFDRLGKELSRAITVEFLGKEAGEYNVKWLELLKRRDLPAYGLGYFMMRPDECQFQCPELDACINATVWCDGIEDCPSGVDESISNCSVIFQLSPLYLFFGALGVLVSSFVTILILWKACRRKPKSILQARLKRLSSDTAILDDKDNIC